MTPTTTPTLTPTLTSALGQLTGLSRPELTILAAAAQALAAASHQPPPIVPPPGPPARAPADRTLSFHRRRRPAPTPADHEACFAPGGERAGGEGPGARPLVRMATPLPASAAPGVPSDGCRLGGRGRGWLIEGTVPLVDPELFASAAYRRRLGPSVPGLLYAAGCDGLLALAERLDEPLYKVGTTEGLTTAARMSTLAAARYASVVRDGAGWREQDGFDHWRAVGLPLGARRGRGSPVQPALRAIAYACPASLPRGALDRAVADALAPAGLDAYASGDEGRATYRARGVDPAELARHTPGPLGRPPGRLERARELVLLGPRADADRIASVLEAIIADHVMGRDPA